MNAPLTPVLGRIALALWFGAGALLGVFAAQTASAPVVPSESSLLLRSSCADIAVSVWSPDGEPRGTVRLREPGVYRLPGATRAAGVVIGTAAERRPSTELPIGDGGELLIPAAWCPTPSPASSPAPGLLGL